MQEVIPVRDIRSIAEALAEHASKSQDPDVLTGHVRVSLGRLIFQHINGMGEELAAMTFDPKLEQVLQSTLQGQGEVIEPGLAEQMMKQLNEGVERMESRNEPPVLLVASSIRQWIAQLIRPGQPALHVLAYEELPGNKRIKVVATIGQDS